MIIISFAQMKHSKQCTCAKNDEIFKYSLQSGVSPSVRGINKDETKNHGHDIVLAYVHQTYD